MLATAYIQDETEFDRQLKSRQCADEQVIQTECSACDYLMVACRHGKVIEAHAPGIAAVAVEKKFRCDRSDRTTILTTPDNCHYILIESSPR